MKIKLKENTCPYCGSNEVTICEDFHRIEEDGRYLDEYLSCEECGGTFWEYYKIAYIETETEEEED